MGGKNCVIVDADADLDDVVPALAYSAFGFAGQKCSRRGARARPRADRRHAARAPARRRRGAAGRPGAALRRRRPAGDRAGARRSASTRYLADRARRGRARLPARHGAAEHGYFVAPAVIDGLPRRLARRRGGDLRPAARRRARARASTRRARSSPTQPFALTGGLFCRDPATVERVSARLPVGNLYVNRHITGAMVARQPFGGNRLSRHRHQGGRPRLPPAVRRAARGDRGHDAPRARG